jgi:2-methylisocitrate lyase-like PEP mutase family enzyme
MVERAVRELERAGAAAVQIEDQVEEKRCGHRPNKRLAEPAEMEERIAAAVSARVSPDFAAAELGAAGVSLALVPAVRLPGHERRRDEGV